MKSWASLALGVSLLLGGAAVGLTAVGTPENTPAASMSGVAVVPDIDAVGVEAHQLSSSEPAPGALSLPTVGFDEPVVETVVPVDGVLQPTGTGLARAAVPGVQADLLIIHSGGGAAGDLLAPRDGQPAVAVGDAAVLEDGAAAMVSQMGVVEKEDFTTAPWVRGALLDPTATVLVSCRRTSGSPERSPYNVVIVIHRT